MVGVSMALILRQTEISTFKINRNTEKIKSFFRAHLDCCDLDPIVVDFGASNTGLCMKGGFSKDSIELWDCCLNHSTEEDGGLSSTYIKANSELSNVAFNFVCC